MEAFTPLNDWKGSGANMIEKEVLSPDFLIKLDRLCFAGSEPFEEWTREHVE